MPDSDAPALLRLSDSLLAHYRKGTRPVRDWRTTTTVAIDVMVYAILSVVSPPLPLLRCWASWGVGGVHPVTTVCPLIPTG